MIRKVRVTRRMIMDVPRYYFLGFTGKGSKFNNSDLVGGIRIPFTYKISGQTSLSISGREEASLLWTNAIIILLMV